MQIFNKLDHFRLIFGSWLSVVNCIYLSYSSQVAVKLLLRLLVKNAQTIIKVDRFQIFPLFLMSLEEVRVDDSLCH